jgi:hypothetical protein
MTEFTGIELPANGEPPLDLLASEIELPSAASPPRPENRWRRQNRGGARW